MAKLDRPLNIERHRSLTATTAVFALYEDLVIHLPPVALSVALEMPRHHQQICTAPSVAQRLAIHHAVAFD